MRSCRCSNLYPAGLKNSSGHSVEIALTKTVRIILSLFIAFNPLDYLRLKCFSLFAGGSRRRDILIMRAKLFGLIALVAMFGISPADAANYTYSVNFMLGNLTVTGSIVTNCQECALLAANIVSWTFTISGPPSIEISSAYSTVQPLNTPGNSPLTATPVSIVFDTSGPPVGEFIFDDSVKANSGGGDFFLQFVGNPPSNNSNPPSTDPSIEFWANSNVYAYSHNINGRVIIATKRCPYPPNSSLYLTCR
jgi:hypothetical protein